MLLDLKKVLNRCWTGKLTGWQLKIISDWPMIMGGICEQARVEKVLNDTLVLGVYDTCWMQQLHLLSGMIIKKVNNHLGHDYIKQIRLKYVQKHQFRKIQPNLVQPGTSHNLTGAENLALKKIKDPELRSAIQNFLNRCSRENK